MGIKIIKIPYSINKDVAKSLSKTLQFSLHTLGKYYIIYGKIKHILIIIYEVDKIIDYISL